jgi:uncharacterized LabA/DUF88 family protein
VERVIAYIDGFNLYYGMKAAYGRKYLWLDVEEMCRSLLKTNQQLVAVKYFTARVRTPQDSQRRQNTYLDALAHQTQTVSIFGRLQMNEVRCSNCGHTRQKPEEKRTDVAIATNLVADAYSRRFDMALLVSGDSDMIPPIQEVSGLAGRRIVVAFPPKRRSQHLLTAAGASTNISEASLRKSQLKQQVVLPNGVVLARPTTWA